METQSDTSSTELANSGADLPVSGTDEQKPIPGATDDNAEAVAETPEQQEAKKQSKFARRLDRQKTARIAAETEAKLLREQVAKLESQGRAQSKDGEPTRDDFPDLISFERAHTDWRRDTKLAAERESGKKAAQASEADAKVAKAWNDREAAFKATNKDYQEVVNEFAGDELQSLSRAARMAIVESDAGPALLYHLANNSEEFERIAGLSEARQAAEIGKLEGKVAMPGKRTTNAPEPARTTSGSRTATKDIAKMSQGEYEAYRKSQGARWS